MAMRLPAALALACLLAATARAAVLDNTKLPLDQNGKKLTPPAALVAKTDDSAGPSRDDPTLICSSGWPSTLPRFHLLNNVSRDASGKLSATMQSGDANGIFFFRGLYHAMNQAGGAWGHAVSNDLVHWHHIKGLLRGHSTDGTTTGFQPCDGTVSFPDLGEAPFDGSAPVVMYLLHSRSISIATSSSEADLFCVLMQY